MPSDVLYRLLVLRVWFHRSFLVRSVSVSLGHFVLTYNVMSAVPAVNVLFMYLGPSFQIRSFLYIPIPHISLFSSSSSSSFVIRSASFYQKHVQDGRPRNSQHKTLPAQPPGAGFPQTPWPPPYLACPGLGHLASMEDLCGRPVQHSEGDEHPRHLRCLQQVWASYFNRRLGGCIGAS